MMMFPRQNSNSKCPTSFQIPIVSHLSEMRATLTATISAVCAEIKTRSKARMEESRRLKVSLVVCAVSY